MERDNVLAFTVFAASIAIFFSWGYEFVPTHHFLIFCIASAFGIFMAFNIGGNDVANSFGTSVGAKTLTIKQALVIAAIFELSGAIFAGGEVTKTIREGIIVFPESGMNPMLFVLIMMSALLSSGIWLFIASKFGLPISTTHSIVGGIVGAGLTMGFSIMDSDEALKMVSWGGIGNIAISWVVSPLMGGILSYFIYRYIKTKILNPTAEYKSQLKILKNERKAYKENYLRELKTRPESEQIKILSSIAIIDEDEIGGERSEYKTHIKSMKEQEKSIDTFRAIRRHIANAVGPFAAILDVLKTSSINQSAQIPNIAMVTFGISLVVGLWFLGKEVIATIGSKLAEILPTTGFSAELAASAVILLATKMGIPVSSTHILIGAILGIGIFNRDANWKMVKPIVLAWVITLPIAGGSAALIYTLLKSALGL